MRRPARTAVPVLAAVVAVLAAVGALGGCSGAVAVAAAPDGADAACARVVEAAPDQVAGGDRRSTTSQGSAAWGDPPVVLRCGVAAPPPSTDCTRIEAADGTSVDWVVGEPAHGRVEWTTFGRTPVVALDAPDDPQTASAAAVDVGPAVALLPARQSCADG